MFSLIFHKYITTKKIIEIPAQVLLSTRKCGIFENTKKRLKWKKFSK